jgi:hypothetical protein
VRADRLDGLAELGGCGVMDTRSFPEIADGRSMPPMADELMSAGLSPDDARFAATQLRRNGFYLVNPDQLGWPDIRRFQEELHGGQGVREDGGGFWIRCIMALFGKKPDPVETYKKAAQRLLREAGQ